MDQLNSTPDKDLARQIDKVSKRYDLLWIVNGIVKEVPIRNVSYASALWNKKKLENSTHKMGRLVFEENGKHQY